MPPQTPQTVDLEGIPDQVGAGGTTPPAAIKSSTPKPAVPGGYDLDALPDQPPSLSGPLGTAITKGSAARKKIAGVIDQNVFEPLNPMTETGRQNLAGMAGGMATAAATEGMSTLPWIARLLAPPIGAALGGAAAEGANQVAGVTPLAGGGQRQVDAGLTQGAYELAGKAVLWPARWALTRFKAGPQVAKQAAAWVEENLTSAKQASADLVDTAVGKGRAYLTGVQATARTSTRAAEAIAKRQLEMDATALQTWQDSHLQAAKKIYDVVREAAPSVLEAGAAVAKVTRTTAPRGAAQVGLDVAGRKVEAAAETGPALPIKPVQDAIEQLLSEAHPSTIFSPAEKSSGIGFIDQLRARRAGEAATSVTSIDQLRLTEKIAKAMGISPEDLAAPGMEGRVKELTNILGRVMTTKETVIPFKDAHRLKLLLDESVNWDSPAKKAMERITKGTRQVLREQLSTHADYNAATTDYAKQVALYRRGAGKALITAARDNPDRVVGLLDPKQPAGAQAMKDLLVEQAAAGGDAPAGLAAWQSLQSNYIYNKIVLGGPEGLNKRIADHLTEHPEFSKIVLGDPTAQKVLSNLDRVGEATQLAMKMIETMTQSAQAASKTAAATTVRTAREAAADRLQQARWAVQDTTRTARHAGAEGVSEALATKKAFQKSSVAPFGESRTIENELTDVGVAAARPGSIYGIRSIMRLLRGPQAAELTQWAAHSDRNTQRLVAALNSSLPQSALAALMREMIGYANQHDDQAAVPLTGTAAKETKP